MKEGLNKDLLFRPEKTRGQLLWLIHFHLIGLFRAHLVPSRHTVFLIWTLVLKLVPLFLTPLLLNQFRLSTLNFDSKLKVSHFEDICAIAFALLQSMSFTWYFSQTYGKSWSHQTIRLSASRCHDCRRLQLSTLNLRRLYSQAFRNNRIFLANMQEISQRRGYSWTC